MRLRPKVVHTDLVCNQSSRKGAAIKGIVVHSTEGNNVPNSARDLVGLGNWFDNPAAQCSSHVGVDGDGQSARYVRDFFKAWTCAYYNPVTLNVEIIGRAADGVKVWFSRTPELNETARWIAHWSIKHGIPIRKGKVGAITRSFTKTGVVRHSELGTAGGGHHDPGPNFPLRYVMARARFYKAARLGR